MGCSAVIRYWLAAALFWLAVPAVAAEPTPAGTAALDQATDLIRYTIALNGAQTVDGRALSFPGEVSRFYWQRGFHPAWVGVQGVLPEAGQLLEVLRHADDDGLRPQDYAVEAIEQKLTLAADPAQLAQLDLLLTDAFLHYGRSARSGRLDPRYIGVDWFIPYTPFDAAGLLQQALDGHDLGQVLAALPPRHPGYLRLRAALGRYRAVAAQGGWPTVEPGPVLRVGVSDPRVVVLRRRLALAGDLATGEGTELYDATLGRAVQRFQRRHGLKADGSVGDGTLAQLNVSVAERVQQIGANMERWRWLPQQEAPRFIMVNMAGFELQVIEAQKVALSMRVIVGRDYRQTPVFSSDMTAVILNPYWYVPPTIFRDDILPDLRHDPAALARRGLTLLSGMDRNARVIDAASVDWEAVDGDRPPYVLRQEPGPHNALGRIKFLLPNHYGIFMHDTPHRGLFEREVRAFSSGCIRLEHPLQLAQYVLGDAERWNRASMEELIAAGKPVTVALPQPLPVVLAYWTAWVDDDGTLQLRDDIYGRDRKLLEAWRGDVPQRVAGDPLH